MKAWLFLIGVLWIVSCSVKDNIPPDVLSQPRIEAVLWDIFRSDEFVASYGTKDTARTRKEKSIWLYEEVFRIHKTNKAQFEKSLEFYTSHPRLFKVVLDSLEKKKNLIIQESHKPVNTTRPPGKPLNVDSLRKKHDSLQQRKMKDLGKLPGKY